MNNYSPAIAKIVKKKTSTIIAYLSKFIAENKARRMSRNGLIDCIVLNGLRTLKERNDERSVVLEPVK
jgi:hypothetical protein